MSPYEKSPQWYSDNTVMQKYRVVFLYESPCDSIINDDNNPKDDRWCSDEVLPVCAGIQDISVIVY